MAIHLSAWLSVCLFACLLICPSLTTSFLSYFIMFFALFLLFYCVTCTSPCYSFTCLQVGQYLYAKKPKRVSKWQRTIFVRNVFEARCICTSAYICKFKFAFYEWDFMRIYVCRRLSEGEREREREKGVKWEEKKEMSRTVSLSHIISVNFKEVAES